MFLSLFLLLLLGYPRAWYETASWLLIVAVRGISQKVEIEQRSRWVLMETAGPIGNQTGVMDASRLSEVGTGRDVWLREVVGGQDTMHILWLCCICKESGG